MGTATTVLYVFAAFFFFFFGVFGLAKGGGEGGWGRRREGVVDCFSFCSGTDFWKK